MIEQCGNAGTISAGSRSRCIMFGKGPDDTCGWKRARISFAEEGINRNILLLMEKSPAVPEKNLQPSCATWGYTPHETIKIYLSRETSLRVLQFAPPLMSGHLTPPQNARGGTGLILSINYCFASLRKKKDTEILRSDL